MNEVYEIDKSNGTLSYERAIQLLKKCMGHIEAYEDDNTETLNVLNNLGFTANELSAFGFEYLIKEEE